MKKFRLTLARILYKLITALVKYQYHLISFADLLDHGKIDDSIKEDKDHA